MDTKLTRLKNDLIYHPVPHSVNGTSEIAKYIRNAFNVSYYLSRAGAEYVISIRLLERERLKDYIKNRKEQDLCMTK